MEKYSRQLLSEGVVNADDIHVSPDSELFRALNLHYNRNNHIEVRISACYNNISIGVYDLLQKLHLFLFLLDNSRFRRLLFSLFRRHCVNSSRLSKQEKTLSLAGKKPFTRSSPVSTNKFQNTSGRQTSSSTWSKLDKGSSLDCLCVNKISHLVMQLLCLTTYTTTTSLQLLHILY